MSTGNADSDGKAGLISLTVGDASVGNGGSILLTAGKSTAAAGGAVTITAGVSTAAAGGALTLAAGASSGGPSPDVVRASLDNQLHWLTACACAAAARLLRAVIAAPAAREATAEQLHGADAAPAPGGAVTLEVIPCSNQSTHSGTLEEAEFAHGMRARLGLSLDEPAARELFLAFDLEGRRRVNVEQLERLLYGVRLSDEQRAALHHEADERRAQWRRASRSWLARALSSS